MHGILPEARLTRYAQYALLMVRWGGWLTYSVPQSAGRSERSVIESHFSCTKVSRQEFEIVS